jgi:photosystem II stability/assembly factor-like uncharacterized protein
MIPGLFVPGASAQQVDVSLFSNLQWRLIGPFRAGRVTAVAGVPGDPTTYYMGTPGGGVWKTTDGGVVWKPIFDSQHVAAIGAVAVAPSNPDIVYVGTGELFTLGNGVYKSTDGGATWTNVGLRETRSIQAIVIDPRDPRIVIVGAGGDFKPGPDRGVYKSKDGGQSWEKVMYRDDTTGVVDMCADPGNRRVLYAAFQTRAFGPPKPGEKVRPPFAGVFKSTDEGSTWKPIGGQGLPEKNQGRIGIAVAPGNRGRRVYAIMDQGFYRSDDAGATWEQSTNDPRVIGSGYFSRIFVDPRNPDILYVAQTSFYRSTDGGHSFGSYVGAPSGDDFHVLWIDPENSARMILGVDQGAIISLDAGKTWSTWYNQPTGQFYHISTDNDFPYRVYAAQQDSGTAAVASRSDYGEIGDRDWYSVAGFEATYIAPDPTDPNIVYSEGWYSSILRFDRRTGQFGTMFVHSSKYRSANMSPLVFSPRDPHTLYLGTQFVLKTQDAGVSWQEISPDLTEKPKPAGAKPAEPGAAPPPGFAAISTLSPSSSGSGEIWAGTTNGLIQLTRDAGATWKNVTPTGDLAPGAINIIEASHHESGTAYVAAGPAGVAAFREPRPYIARTHDYGQSWQKITAGLPADEGVSVVREDPALQGLLYAGTANGIFVSFDDGDHWQPLQLNLPTSTVTDITVHGDDLAVSTFGRALWILDDISPLRQANAQIAASDAYLFQPETAVRVRWDNNQDTPFPIETPTAKNPPDGAILNYYLKQPPAGDITLTISDEQGTVVRRFSSAPPPEEAKEFPPNVPTYWLAPPEMLPKKAGVNRFAWDLRYTSPPALPYSYYGNLIKYTEFTLADHAIPGETPHSFPQGPLALPGHYVAELQVGGQTYRQTLVVKPDPRVTASSEDLEDQLQQEMRITAGLKATFDGFHEVTALRTALADREKALGTDAKVKDATDAAKALKEKIDAVAEGTHKAPGMGPVNRDLARLATALESADVRPPETAHAAVDESCKALDADLIAWHDLNVKDVVAFNAILEQHKLATLPVATGSQVGTGCQSGK